MIRFTSEKELEKCLMDNQSWMIDQFELSSKTKFYNQVNVSPYGIIDILAVCAVDKRVNVTVIELKNENLLLSHLAQTARYIRFFEIFPEILPEYEIYVDGVLFGPTVWDDDSVFLAQKTEDISVYSLTLDPTEGMKATLVDGWEKKGEISEDTLSNIEGLFS